MGWAQDASRLTPVVAGLLGGQVLLARTAITVAPALVFTFIRPDHVLGRDTCRNG